VVKLHGGAGDVIDTGSVLVTFQLKGEEVEPDAANTEEETPPEESDAAQAPKAPLGADDDSEVFLLPDLGEGLPDAEIVKWLVAEGDTIVAGEDMVEMSTAKAVVEVPSPFSGKVVKLYGGPGDVIETGHPLISIATGKAGGAAKPIDKPAAGEPVDAAPSVVGAMVVGHEVKAEAATGTDGIRAGAAVRALARKQKIDLSGLAGSGPGGEITLKDIRGAKAGADSSAEKVAVKEKTSAKADSGGDIPAGPAAKALAASLDIDLAALEPTGPKGSISKQDVLAAAKSRMGSGRPLARGDTSIAGGKGIKAAPKVRAYARDKGIDISSAKATGHSGNVTSADVDAALKAANDAVMGDFSVSDYRPPERTYEVTGEPQRLVGPRRVMAQAMTKANAEVCSTSIFDQADIESWPKGTDITGRIMRSVIAAAMVEPAINAWYDGEAQEVTLHKNVSLGMAVDSPKGLFVPVIKDADDLSPEARRAELDRLRAAIGKMKIKAAEMSGATLTISNFGMIAGRFATPIVSVPEVAIVGIGGLFNELVLVGEQVEQHRQMPVSLTFDHRAATGGEAARFLAAMIADLSLSY
ncbi:MAG: 2-oxo acid dehydrogenase subunit E2, partial [Sphingomonadales bacterium]